MGDYLKTLSRHRRIAILQHLDACESYTSNAAILVDVLRGVGITSSTDQVITELAWLKEQGFVTIQDAGGFLVVEATARGLEVARGIATHPEVERPRPRR